MGLDWRYSEYTYTCLYVNVYVTQVNVYVTQVNGSPRHPKVFHGSKRECSSLKRVAGEIVQSGDPNIYKSDLLCQRSCLLP